MGMSSTFLHHILTSILQTNEWKTLSPHLTDLQEEELLQVYETLQGSPFATQFQKVLRPIFEMQFIEHLKDLPKPVDERDSKKSIRQHYLHHAILHFTHQLPPRFYLPVFSKHFNHLDPFRASLYECTLCNTRPFRPTFDLHALEWVQPQLYTLCRP
ncbi:hypothetical protein HMI55_000347 [Coelomomyces lativittatus]|nr:hypothetical protein HMI55_000347 [Coelomomyces lativittatus]